MNSLDIEFKRTGAAQIVQTLIFTLVAFVVLIAAINTAFAATPAGSLIRNQASATYVTDDGVEQFATSNIVETVVRQAAGVELAQSQNKLVGPSGTIIFPHVVTNSGNGPDSFLLDTTQLGGDDFDFVGVTLFADYDQNGIADDSIPITASPVLAAEDSFSFVAVANVPAGLSIGQFAETSITATSSFDASQSTSNVDRGTITSGAIVDVSKSMNVTTGESPSGPYTVTLDYHNSGTAVANNVALIDALPTGMSYVPNSARWSLDDTIVLTDSNPSDAQGSAPNTIQFCAYNASCINLPEATRDADSLSSNQVTAVIAQVNPGDRGRLSFNVTIDSGVVAEDLFNAAEFEYDDNGTLVSRVETNVVAFRVSQATGVVANGSTTSNIDGTNEPVNIVTATQGATVDFDNVIWNTGNDVDIIDIIVDNDGATFPQGTGLQLYRGDSNTPLLDNNGNGIPDTGPLEPGESFIVVLRATLAPDAVGNNGGAGFQVTKTARSSNDPNASNSVTDLLNSIGPSAIDLTNSAAAGTTGALGEGAGAESSAVLMNSAIPGETTQFSLFVTNIGNTPDQWTLNASTDPTFATTVLPDGWSLVFTNADGSETLTNTGSLSAGNSVEIMAVITVPEDQTDVVQSLYFQALSPVTGSADIIHDSIEVVSAPSLLLEPPGNAQVEAGNAFVYSHRIENSSNAAVTNINLSTSDTLASSGWTSILYEDTNNDGIFSSADQPINSLANLPAGESAVLFVRVVSPANAAAGGFNVTTLTASANGGSLSVSVEDVTTIASGDIAITKEQAPDIGCDGTLDGPYSAQPFFMEPGNNCVRYRLTATNAGIEPVFNAIIEDATPPFTVYEPSAACSATPCTIVEPNAGGTGIVSGEVASVAPGESVELTFAVVIE